MSRTRYTLWIGSTLRPTMVMIMTTSTINLLVESLVPFGIQSDNFVLKSFGDGGLFTKWGSGAPVILAIVASMMLQPYFRMLSNLGGCHHQLRRLTVLRLLLKM